MVDRLDLSLEPLAFGDDDDAETSDATGDDADVASTAVVAAELPLATHDEFLEALWGATSLEDLLDIRGTLGAGKEGVHTLKGVCDELRNKGDSESLLRAALADCVLGRHEATLEQLGAIGNLAPAFVLAAADAARNLCRFDDARKLAQKAAKAGGTEEKLAAAVLQIEIALIAGGSGRDDENGANPLMRQYGLYDIKSGANAGLAAAEKVFSTLRRSDNAQYHFARGLILDARGEGREALTEYKLAYELDTRNNPGILFRYAYYADLFEVESEDGELIAPALYAELRGSSTLYRGALVNLGLRFEDEEQYADAIECYNLVLCQFPTDSVARMFLKDATASLSMYYDEDQERRDDKRAQVLRTPVTEFELSVRSRNCLSRMNIQTLGDLVQKTEQELLSYKNFGETSLQEIKQILASKNLRLGMTGTEALAPTPPEPEEAKDEVLLRPILDLDLSVRIRKVMEKLNIVTIGDLLARKESDLTKLKNFGKTSLAELKRKLAEHSVTMRQ